MTDQPEADSLTFAYRPQSEESEDFIWSVVGAAGAVHIWARQIPPGFRHSEEWYGGIEVHSRTPFSYSDPEPDNTDCWLLNGVCWHDGSSLQFSERIAPLLGTSGADFNPALHAIINGILVSRYRHQFPTPA